MYYMTYVIERLTRGMFLPSFLFSFLSFSGARNDDPSWLLYDMCLRGVNHDP